MQGFIGWAQSRGLESLSLDSNDDRRALGELLLRWLSESVGYGTLDELVQRQALECIRARQQQRRQPPECSICRRRHGLEMIHECE